MPDGGGGGLLTVNAVHYHDRTPQEARDYFESIGFRGIRSIEKSAPINCNTARTEVRATADRGGPAWHYRGNYDATSGQACSIYTIVCAAMPADRG